MSPCYLPPVNGRVGERLFDAHLAPVHIEFLRNQHRQHGLNALPDLGILRHNGHDIVWRNANIGIERRSLAAGPRSGSKIRQGKAQKEPASGRSTNFQKIATRCAAGRKRLSACRSVR